MLNLKFPHKGHNVPWMQAPYREGGLCKFPSGSMPKMCASRTHSTVVGWPSSQCSLCLNESNSPIKHRVLGDLNCLNGLLGNLFHCGSHINRHIFREAPFWKALASKGGMPPTLMPLALTLALLQFSVKKSLFQPQNRLWDHLNITSACSRVEAPTDVDNLD